MNEKLAKLIAADAERRLLARTQSDRGYDALLKQNERMRVLIQSIDNEARGLHQVGLRMGKIQTMIKDWRNGR